MLFFQIQGSEERFLNFVGTIYESIVISIAIFMLVLIYLRYREKQHELTLYLLFIFLFYVFGIFFSLISKIFVVLQIDTLVDPYSPLGWIFYRIMSFRVAELMICVAIFISYVLKIKLFHDGYNTIQKYIVVIVGIATAFFDFFIYSVEEGTFSTLLDTIAFLLTFIFMGMIYFPFSYRAYDTSKRVESSQYRTAFLSLGIMAICYILVFFSFFLDRLLMLILDIPGFTPFYYSAWGFAITAVLGAYFGYIKPKAGEK